MEEPSLSSRRHDWRRRLVIWVGPMLLLLAVGLSLFKQCTELGKAAHAEVYDPQDNGAGFVTKADSVLSLLLSQDFVDTTVEAISVEALNKRYKALEFAVPFEQDRYASIESSNLRLVGIHPEYIKDEDLRRFYYNSRLPQLLERQAENLAENYFNISTKNVHPSRKLREDNPRHVLPVVVNSISLIPSMFKVRMTKAPWKGVIEGRENALFSEEGTIFLSYGNSVLPIHNDTVNNMDNIVNFNAILNEGILLWTKPVRSGQKVSPPEPIDYYSYYKRTFDCDSTPHGVCIRLQNTRQSEERAHIIVSYSNGVLKFKHTCGLLVVGKNKSQKIKDITRADQRPTEVPFEDGMKILMYTMDHDDLSMKLGEITISKENPMRMLSYLTQSSIGVDRFYISDYQTDLFTQQLLQGLSKHFSNRENIDTVKLTIDPLLSREFEDEIKAYVHSLPNQTAVVRAVHKPKSQKNEQYDMSVTIMDMATGEVLASPFYTTLFDHEDFPEQLKLTARNTSLIRRSIGSTFKPMEALASVLSMPSLINMNTAETRRYGTPDFDNERVEFFGRYTKPWAEYSKYFWNGCDFATFLSRSDDVYPVGLVALALSDGSSAERLPINGEESYFSTYPRKDKKQGTRYQYLRFKDATRHEKQRSLDAQPFIVNLSDIYGINYGEDYDYRLYNRTADINLFQQLVEGMDKWEDRVFGLNEVSPDPTQLHFDRFDDGDDFHDLLMPWVLGQGDNMWNCVKLAEAWARMISKRAVNASFIRYPSDKTFPSLVNDSLLQSFSRSPDYNNTWNSFLEKFRQAQGMNHGLLLPMQQAVDRLNEGLVLFSKTGTPDAYTPPIDIPLLGGRVRKMDLGMYCFVLTKEQMYQENIRNNRPSKGIVCIVRISRTYECANCGVEKCEACKKYWGLESSHARNFFTSTSGQARLRKLYDMTKNYYN